MQNLQKIKRRTIISEHNPFESGIPAIVLLHPKYRRHDDNVIGPLVLDMAHKFHVMLEELQSKGQCPSCVAFSVFATITVNVLNGIVPDNRHDGAEYLRKLIRLVEGHLISPDYSSQLLVQDDEESDLPLSDNIHHFLKQIKDL